ncbi:spherulation-specific family 4 protein [Amycolatopsis sp. NPDC059657]|uniref:spherulation-specific family 4 protein n=1 Tax=Amycolatopsis sp. NPDC059657 TaxID=3346899 RepID=UPI00366FB6C4
MKLRRHLAATAVLLLATAVSAPGIAAACDERPGTIVPLYSYPTAGTWTTLIEAKKRYPSVPVIAIVNPASGPGVAPDPEYLIGISRLREAGVIPIGYVTTSYATRTAEAVRAEIDLYQAWYPKLQGMFLDEMSNVEGLEGYYRDLSQYSKKAGFKRTVANPGTSTLRSFVGTVDTLIVYENSGLPATCSTASWQRRHNKGNFAVLGYNIESLRESTVDSCTSKVGWVYFTHGGMPNPWDGLPPYLDKLLCYLK